MYMYRFTTYGIICWYNDACNGGLHGTVRTVRSMCAERRVHTENERVGARFKVPDAVAVAQRFQ